MPRKTLVTLILLGIVIIGIWYVFFGQKKVSLSSPLSVNLEQENSPSLSSLKPSKTLKDYADPSGFSFSYPDNLSLVSNEPKTTRVYSDLDLSAKGFTKGLKIEISDSSFKSLNDWVKANETEQSTKKDVKLGTLKAIEITASNRILLGALDQGVLFTIDASLSENKDFWMEVYNQVVKDFTFVAAGKDTAKAPTTQSVGESSSDVTFEGEEVVN